MDFRKTKSTLLRACAIGLAALMLSSCITGRSLEVQEPESFSAPLPEPQKPSMPSTTNDVMVQAVAVDESTWNEMQEQQRRQELMKQAKAEAERLERERIEAERLEAERLEKERMAEAERLERERIEEASRLESERLERERIRAEQLEAERLEAEKQIAERLAEEALLSAQIGEENKPLAYIVDETEKDTGSSWRISEDGSVPYIPIPTETVSIEERSRESDRILAGETGGVPSWLLSPKEQEESASTGSELQVVNIYQPMENREETSTVTADDILALGTMYKADRESKTPVTQMNREQIIGKITELVIIAAPYILIGLALLVSLLLLRFLKNRVMDLTRKKKTDEQDGVEVISDGFMVARPGQGSDTEDNEPENESADATSSSYRKEDDPETDPRINGKDTGMKSSNGTMPPVWNPVNRYNDVQKENEEDASSSGRGFVPE